MLDLFGGTLIIDEGDFRFSDEKAEITKILNNGNVRGMPVLRAQMRSQREFDASVFNVYGPKIIAMRGEFEDEGLESRFITGTFDRRPLRDDIPINLPHQYEAEAAALRNKLLLYRFRNWKMCEINEKYIDRSIEPRLNQMFAPLLSIVANKEIAEALRELAREYDRARRRARNGNERDEYRWEEV